MILKCAGGQDSPGWFLHTSIAVLNVVFVIHAAACTKFEKRPVGSRRAGSTSGTMLRAEWYE